VEFVGDRQTAAYFICTLLKRRKDALRLKK